MSIVLNQHSNSTQKNCFYFAWLALIILIWQQPQPFFSFTCFICSTFFQFLLSWIYVSHVTVFYGKLYLFFFFSRKNSVMGMPSLYLGTENLGDQFRCWWARCISWIRSQLIFDQIEWWAIDEGRKWIKLPSLLFHCPFIPFIGEGICYGVTEVLWMYLFATVISLFGCTQPMHAMSITHYGRMKSYQILTYS